MYYVLNLKDSTAHDSTANGPVTEEWHPNNKVLSIVQAGPIQILYSNSAGINHISAYSFVWHEGSLFESRLESFY